MNDCKNCKYTDEYCASGDCNKTQVNNLARNKISLTEQFDNDEITKGSYYCKSKLDGHECIAGFISNKGLFDCDYNGTLNKGYWEILAPVPSYEEWQAAQEQINKDGVWYTEISHKKVLKENAQLKELLKECKGIFDECFSPSAKHGELYKKIDEVLR